jgi:hypothetical protein
VYRAFALERSYSTNCHRPRSLRITANWPTNIVPGFTIVFTITVPFGYVLPSFRWLA